MTQELAGKTVHLLSEVSGSFALSLEQFHKTVSSERSDLNTTTSRVLTQDLSDALVSFSSAVEKANSVLTGGVRGTDATKVSLSTFLSAGWVWNWLVDGRGKANTSSVSGALTQSCWRKRCRVQRQLLEQQVAAGESVGALSDSLANVRVELAEKSQQLSCALRRGEELTSMLDKQTQALAASELVAAREAERAKKQAALEQEVCVLTEAIAVLEGRLEIAQAEARKGGGGSSGGSGLSPQGSNEVWEGGDGAASAAALRGAIILGRGWRALAMRRLASGLKPLPTPVSKPSDVRPAEPSGSDGHAEFKADEQVSARVSVSRVTAVRESIAKLERFVLSHSASPL